MEREDQYKKWKIMKFNNKRFCSDSNIKAFKAISDTNFWEYVKYEEYVLEKDDIQSVKGYRSKIKHFLLSDEMRECSVFNITQARMKSYPYLSMFKVLNLQKQSKGVMVSMMIMSSVFIFTIPSGIGIYYFASSLFTAVEQFVINFYASKRLAIEN